MAGITNERLLTPAEVAAILRVGSRTVSRWAPQGRIDAIRTSGGHRRFHETEVSVLLGATQTSALRRSGPPRALPTPTAALDHLPLHRMEIQ
jgi:excisionase family DNA binding protein